MPPSQRSWLPFLRLLLAFVALCLLLAQLEVALRLLADQTVGLPNPILSYDPLPPPSDIPFMGISIDSAQLPQNAQTIATQEEIFRQLAGAGIGWVRVRVAWDQIEPSPGNYQWETLDHTISRLADAKLIPVLLLDGSPAWVRAKSDLKNAKGKFAPPENLATFVNFAHTVAIRYGDRVRYYQIWNEPNIAPHWGARLIEPVDYARMLKAASIAIRQVDRDAKIILAALAPTEDRGHLAQDEVYYLDRLYAAGAAPYFDAVAVQPFGFAARPDASEADHHQLNFRRTLLIRQAMIDAGDGQTPIWLVRFGWNRLPASPWQSVSAQEQNTFTLNALEMAYRQWPWVVAMGWPAATTPDEDDAGFALTPELLRTFHTASIQFLAEPRPLHTPKPPLTLWIPATLWLLAVLAIVWRGAAAAQAISWQEIGEHWRKRLPWQQAICWALLLLIYYFAVWLPLLFLCAIIAALGFLAQPRWGLALALILLPFFDYHKEFDWLGHHWLVPPALAVLLCLLPAIWLYRPKPLPWDRWQAVALSWLIIMLLSATGVWYWPAYWAGLLNLVVTPLLLFLLIRAWATTRLDAQYQVAALAAGGLLVTVIGLADWLNGGGTVADGLRRLTGVGATSNHTALYLVRTLPITIGLALTVGAKEKWLWGAGAILTTIALLLTGSRGAILLGIPAAAFFLLSRQKFSWPSRGQLLGLLVILGAILVMATFFARRRFTNWGTMIARMDGWSVSLNLWLDHFLFGVGPDGFWWTFPGKMWLTSNADPNLRHPHLIWLELATSGGVLALGWFLVVAYLLFHWALQRRNVLSWLQVGLLMGLIAAVAHAQVDAFQVLPELAGWNWAALGLLLALDKTEP